MNIRDLQLAAVDRMVADPVFADLVVVRDAGDVLTAGADAVLVEDELARGLNANGVAFRVPLTRGDASFPAVPSVLCEFDMQVEIWFRRYGPGGVLTDWIEQVVGFFHFWRPLQSGQTTVPKQPIWQVREQGGLQVATISFRAYSQIGTTVEKVAAPTGVLAAGSVTISCTTSGATIYATTNGSYPAIRSEMLVSEPVPLTAGQVLLARAYAPNKLASDLLKIVA
jgi:Chitobiase/beta-hexosaminidase C-terminal domain